MRRGGDVSIESLTLVCEEWVVDDLVQTRRGPPERDLGGATHGLLALAQVFDEGGETKGVHFEVNGGVEEEFEITVDNVVSLHGATCTSEPLGVGQRQR